MSVEDDVSLSWVNSNPPQLSDTTWDAMQDALLDILSSETPLGYNTSVAVNQRQGTVEAQVTHHYPVRDDHIPSFLAVQDALRDTLSSDTCLGCNTSVAVNDEFQAMDSLMSGETEVTQSPAKNTGEFADNYPPLTGEAEIEQFQSYLLNTKSNLRGLMKGKKTEAAPDLSFTDETEFPLEDIFKVWDLNIPLYEEDELVKQLELALGEGPLSTEPLVHDDSISDMDIEAVDDLISGIADLSLRPVSRS